MLLTSRMHINNLRKQKGAALMMIAVMIAITASILLARNLNSSAQSTQREQLTLQSLSEAKAALIAYSQSDSTLPGQLPCPENTSLIGTSSEGSASATCTTDSARIGRLPWHTLGINQLKDSDGEPLWYAVSSGFRAAPINSDTVAQLSLNGTANAAVAIVFAPGAALSGQSRPTVTAVSAPVQSAYLDQENSNADTTFVNLTTSSNFNDQLMTISHAELFQPLEKRVLNELKTNLATYKTTWNAYPFPAPYSNPSVLNVNSFDGSISEVGGLLPISDPAATYNDALHTYRLVDNVSGAVITGTCVASNATRVQCNASIPSSGGAIRSWTGTANLYFSNVGKGFITSNLTLANINTTSATSTYIRPTSSTTRFTVTKTALNKKVDSAGNGILQFVFTVSRTTSTATTLRVNLAAVHYPNTTATWTNTGTSWLMTNNWYRFIYYRVASLYLPSGNIVLPTCNADCLSINKTVADGTVLITTNVPAIILSAGKALTGQSHANGLLTDYFDSANNAAGATIFDQKVLLTDTFNDQIKALDP